MKLSELKDMSQELFDNDNEESINAIIQNIEDFQDSTVVPIELLLILIEEWYSAAQKEVGTGEIETILACAHDLRAVIFGADKPFVLKPGLNVGGGELKPGAVILKQPGQM